MAFEFEAALRRWLCVIEAQAGVGRAPAEDRLTEPEQLHAVLSRSRRQESSGDTRHLLLHH